MKNLLFILTVASLIITSCSKDEEGCNDRRASNYDEKVIVDDGSCMYTTVTFYADSSQYNGKTISNIEVTVGGEIIGSFNGHFTDNSQVCGATNTAIYNTTGDTSVVWSAVVYLNNSTTVTSSGEYIGITNQTCVIQQVIPE
jgi:hypothetical protein